MDEKVLDAQRWVNATYGNVNGYNDCPEDGRTSWSTMYSLTRALQHELGIASLSDNFGPTTLSRLADRGPIGPAEPNTNIRKIVQHALFCKGYWGGDGQGTWDGSTQSSVRGLKTDAGISNSTTTVEPKVFKALLTMDAYVLLSGGRETVRSIQQWLNGRYLNRSQFFVMPCDGHYSRDVQRALIYAIQYEIGMSDSVANGVFGPGTQTGLRDHPVMLGDSGVFVQLFSAGMVFNTASQDFRATFDAGLQGEVNEFQEFSALPKNGRGDFQTWAQLLVSTGDPSRPGTAADCISTVTPTRAQTLIAEGYQIVGRYLDERPSSNPLNKQIQPGELETIFSNGLRVFPISQYYGGEAEYFSYSQGVTDARAAHVAASNHGFSASTVIYFAVDYDATDPEIDAYIIPYFRGVTNGLNSMGRKYSFGVYGSRNVCRRVSAETDARWSFVSGMSTGFSGNMGFALPPNWAFNQIAEISIGSDHGQIAIDKNIWRPNTDRGVSAINQPGASVGEFIQWMNRLYDFAVDYGMGNPSLRVLEYLRYENYSGSDWVALIGHFDSIFIFAVDQSGIGRMSRFRDPGTNELYDISHFGASCNGVLTKGLVNDLADMNEADFAGWAGDLITFYDNWDSVRDTGISGFDFCMEELGRIGAEHSFPSVDMIADIDAFEIGIGITHFGSNLRDEIERVFGSGNQFANRYRQLWLNRFDSSVATAYAAANKALTGDLGLIMNKGRDDYLTDVRVKPSDLPSSELDNFLRGFANVIRIRAEQTPSHRVRRWRTR